MKRRAPKLTPCPFCEAEPETFVKVAHMGKGPWTVVCMRCSCHGPFAPDPVNAIRLWGLSSKKSEQPMELGLCKKHDNQSIGFGMCFHAEDALKENKPGYLWSAILCDKCRRLIALFKPGKRFCRHDNFAQNPDGTVNVIRGKGCICKEK